VGPAGATSAAPGSLCPLHTCRAAAGLLGGVSSTRGKAPCLSWIEAADVVDPSLTSTRARPRARCALWLRPIRRAALRGGVNGRTSRGWAYSERRGIRRHRRRGADAPPGCRMAGRLSRRGRHDVEPGPISRLHVGQPQEFPAGCRAPPLSPPRLPCCGLYPGSYGLATGTRLYSSR
jgi:hypothetical protein